jgi:plastocyanin domain-containing protein
MSKMIPRILMIVAAAALALGCGKGDDKKAAKTKPTPAAANKPPAAQGKPAPTAPAAGRRVAIEVTNSSYVPAEIEAKAGEALTLVFTRTGEGKCGEFVKVGGSADKTELPLSKPVEIAVKAPASGELGFACGMDMMKGKIVVAD